VAERKPIVMVNGQLKELPGGDALPPQPPASHSHAVSDVAGLQTALDGKEPALGFKLTVSTTAPTSPAVGDIWISY